MGKASRLILGVVSLLIVSAPAWCDQAGPIYASNPGAVYNYVPTAMMGPDGVQKFWWCSGPSPSDTIMYMAINLNTGQYQTPPTAVLREGPPGAWDSVYTCDPSVTRGSWPNPLGDGVTYTYAMYYTGTDQGNGDPRGDGLHNGVGVAFSNDGVNWNKYPFPIYRNGQTNPVSYGVGEQSVFSASGGADVWMFVVNAEQSPQTLQLFYSPDGLHLQFRGAVSTSGLIPYGGVAGVFLQPDFGYDDNTGYLYCISDRVNNPAVTDIYRLSFGQLLTGGTWQNIGSLGPGVPFNPTGNYLNGSGGLLKNEFGRVTPFLPTIEAFFATGSGPGVGQGSSLMWWQMTAP